MTDKQLIACAKEFRKGIVQGKGSNSYCFMVCAPLAGYLHAVGLPVEVKESEVDCGEYTINHVWIQLPDGRVLDPTADQFNSKASTLPPVYLGPPQSIHKLGGQAR